MAFSGPAAFDCRLWRPNFAWSSALTMILFRPELLLVGIAVLLAAAPSSSASEPQNGLRYQEAARDYRHSDASGKRQFLAGLMSRHDAASSVTTSGAELKRLRERNRAILDRAATGRELSDSGLLELLAEVDAQEQHAIAKLRRDFAFSTAQAFYDNRADFDKWHDAWERIESRYQQDGCPLALQKRMIDWLALASARQAQISVARLQLGGSRRGSLPERIPTQRKADIQHSELESRIAGYNLAVSRLFSELHSKRAWSVEDLGRAAGELADLATTRHDLNLYWNLLPRGSQARQTPLRSLDDVIPLLARRTAERRRELVHMAADSPRAAWELRRLDEVSRRLATLATPRS